MNIAQNFPRFTASATHTSCLEVKPRVIIMTWQRGI